MCLFNWPQTQLANILKTINPQVCLRDEHWWMMKARAGRKPMWGQTRWFNIFIFKAILFFPLILWNSFAVKRNSGPNMNWDGQRNFMHYQNGRNFTLESYSKSRRPVIAASVAITYLLWFLEMQPQRPYRLFVAGRHRLFSLSWMGTRQILHFHYSSMALPSGGAWARAETGSVFWKGCEWREPQPEINTALPHHPHT